MSRDCLPCGSGHDSRKVVGAIHHYDRKDKRRNETNRDGAHQCARNDDSWVFTFLREMHSPVNPSVHVVWRNQAGEEGHTIRPATFVKECSPYGLSCLIVWCCPNEAGDGDGQKAADRHEN